MYNNPRPGLISRTVAAALSSLPPAPALALLAKLLKEDTVTKLVSGKKQLADYDIPGVEMDKLWPCIKEVEDEVFSVHGLFASNVLGFSPGQQGVVTNGRYVDIMYLKLKLKLKLKLRLNYKLPGCWGPSPPERSSP